MSFTRGVFRWSAKADKAIKEFNAEIIFRLYASVIRDTPVLEGRLRGNWFPSMGKPSSMVDDGFKGSQGEATKASVSRVEKFMLDFDGSKDFEVFLTNNLPYAARIEYDGYSAKAPAGMVRKNLLRIASNIKKFYNI